LNPECSIETGTGLEFVVEDALLKPVKLNWFAAPDGKDGVDWENLVINGLVTAEDSVAEAPVLISEKEGREGPAITVAVLDAQAGKPERKIN